MERTEAVENKNIETEISLQKIYAFPEEIEIVEYNGNYLVIYTEGIMWIVLENSNQLDIFNELRMGKCIEHTLEHYDENDVMNVIQQIEAKGFEKPIITELTEKNAYIYLTNNCNQRCKHCYMYAGEFDIEEVDYKEWITVLDSLKMLGYIGVTFTGGEITVYNGFELLIKHAHKIGLKVTVLSNGVLWDELLIDELYKYIDEIQISLDGYNEESYYNVRRDYGFERAMKCVREFCKRGTRVSIAATPLYEKLDDFIEGFAFVAKEILQQYPEVFIKLNYELIVGREVCTTEDENIEYRNKIKKLIKRLYPNYDIEGFVINYINKAIRKNCGFGGISIASNGDVYWCNRIHELKSEMNVFKSNIEDIEAMSDLVKEKTSVDNTKGCKNCEIRYICGGGCRIKYEGIQDVLNHQGEWAYSCDGKSSIYEKMISSNEYFFGE